MTLAQLKRDAKAGMSLELIERFGGCDEKHIPDRMKGSRKVIGQNTVALKLLNHDGKESELRLDNAKLTEYTGDTLTIYTAGYRPLTDQERAVLDEGIRRGREYEEKYPSCSGYWIKKSFYEKSDCPWMEGYDYIRGMKYDSSKDMIHDSHVRGDAILKYRVYKGV